MNLISWNVNGIRACLKKGFGDFFKSIDADIFCLQETKMQVIRKQENIECNDKNIKIDKKSQQEVDELLELPIFKNYYSYWNSAEKKGYSGTAIFTKQKPLSVHYGIGIEEHDKEGRVITLEFEKFFMVDIYTPNAKRELERLEYRQIWEDEIRKYLSNLSKQKPVIMCGDLNVAHKEIDLKNPKSNRGHAGFTDEERSKMTELIDAGFVDTFRYLYPEKQDCYSWWSYMGKAREKNVGWRIDYFIVSNEIKEKIIESKIYPEIMGSDHCPVGLQIELS
jgi:exodeoxyribonuclease-3